MYTSLIYNVNVASSITTAGRSLTASMILHFEMLLNNNVKFGSLDEVVEFINHVVHEGTNRKFDDRVILNHWISPEECFAKLILSCGYRWIPNESEMDIIWKIVNNLTPLDLNRVYYKNNLFEFCSNVYVFDLIKTMLHKLEAPMMNASEIPVEIEQDLLYFKDLIMEYVYYRYLFIDRIDRCDNMIKSVTMISDTDSAIISLDGWYRFVVEKIKGESFKIANDTPHPALEEDIGPLKEKVLDYDFNTDEVVEIERESNPTVIPANDNVKYTIINMFAYVIYNTVNDYMKKVCENIHSLDGVHHSDCKIISKNEFLMPRAMMTMNKKNYASLIALQEGNIVPEDEQLDVKGIQILTKSVTPPSTKKALKKILLEDILRAPVIDQVKFIKDMAIFEKQIIESIRNGSKEYYKPATVKSIDAYADPLRIQGVKASIAWNMLKLPDDPAININERNAVNIAKVKISRANADRSPLILDNVLKALDDDTFKTYSAHPDPKTGEKKLMKNSIEAVAIPLDVDLPEWLEPFIDYDSIIADNLNGFPYESIGLKRLNKSSINYTKISHNYYHPFY